MTVDELRALIDRLQDMGDGFERQGLAELDKFKKGVKLGAAQAHCDIVGQLIDFLPKTIH